MARLKKGTGSFHFSPLSFSKSLPPEKKKLAFLICLETVVVLLLILILGWDGPVGRFFKSFSDPVVKSIEVEGLNSPYYIVVQAQGGKTVARHWSEEYIHPASLTKIMTCQCALEKIRNLKRTIVLDEEIFEGLYEEDASQAGFQVGEEVSAQDLFYGAILPSGAECTNALAKMACGSVEAFIEYMNKRAKELGMKDTHFANTMGLSQEDHYSTCKDMAILLRVALKKKVLREILSAPYYTTAGTNLHPGGITFYSTLFRNMDDNTVTAGEILGGKTGYTSEAGLCLASFARVGGREYIAVTAGAEANGYPLHVYDAQTIYEEIGQAAIEAGYEP